MGTAKMNMGIPVKFPGFREEDCRSIITFWDDFLSTTTGAVDAARWLHTETTGAVTSLAATDASQEMTGGLVSLSTSATSTDICAMAANGEHFQIDQGYPLYFETRWANTNTGFAGSFIGLAKYNIGEEAFRTPASPQIGFLMSEDKIDVVSENAGGQNNDADLATIADSIWYRSAFYYDGDNTVTFWLSTGGGDFVQIDELYLDTTADYVPEDLMMTPAAANECYATGASVLYIDYILVQQQRCFAPE